MPEFTCLTIDDTDTLRDRLSAAARTGIDTEFMREKTYFPQLCLIQVAIETRLYCIDPLVSASPDAFWTSLLAPAWVLHSGRQDLEVVYQSAGRLPDSVFDTQVAAALLGYPPQTGYANLVAELFDVQLAKSQTRADWTHRPLSEAALAYAAEDVEHLLPARNVLSERLEDLGRLDWAIEDSADLLDTALYRVDIDGAVDRVKGARNMRGQARRAAAGLARWREQKAEASDRPRQWVLRDAVLLEMAAASPRTRQSLTNIAGMPAATARRAGDELLQILADARAASDDYTPPARPDEEQKALMKRLQKQVARCASDLGIAAEVLAPRKELSAALTGDRDTRVFRGWRRRVIGDDLLAMLD